MAMKSPRHPGRLVRLALDELGWSVTDAARALGITRQHLNNVVAGRSAISPDMALRLEKGLGSDAETWIAMQRAHDLAEARRIFDGAGLVALKPKASIAAAE